MRVLVASDRALLVEAADLDEAMRLYRAWGEVPGVVELVPGARTVLVRYDPLVVRRDELAAVLAATETDAAPPEPTGEVTIPVAYDGEDLDDAAALLGVSAEEVIARHLAAEWQVAFAGFAPGFGYLVGSDPLFDVPRRETPRTRVPAGAVGLAGRFTGVYPRESPGGWQLIGRTDTVMWDIDRDPPALLRTGVRVRFVRAPSTGSGTQALHGSLSLSKRPSAELSGGGPSTGSGTHFLTVIAPALQLLVQDAGRPGHAALGVSASGVADRTAMRDANRAVGNAPDAAVLECVGGVALRYHGVPTVVAVAGASADSGIRPGEPFAVNDGDEISLLYPDRGLRYVIAVRGGIRAVPALGSVASDTLAGLGPSPLKAGDLVETGDPRTAPHAVEPATVPRDLPAAGDIATLRITLGPRDEWFTPASVAALTAQDWTVTAQADRVGIRLHGETPLRRAISDELPSEGAVTGAVQVPPDGQPVLFLPDHPLTGGYPIIGAVIDADLDLAGQLPPGARVRFRIAR